MIGHNLRKNCLIKHITEGSIGGVEVIERRGKRLKQLLDDLKGKKGY